MDYSPKQKAIRLECKCMCVCVGPNYTYCATLSHRQYSERFKCFIWRWEGQLVPTAIWEFRELAVNRVIHLTHQHF